MGGGGGGGFGFVSRAVGIAAAPFTGGASLAVSAGIGVLTSVVSRTDPIQGALSGLVGGSAGGVFGPVGAAAGALLASSSTAKQAKMMAEAQASMHRQQMEATRNMMAIQERMAAAAKEREVAMTEAVDRARIMRERKAVQDEKRYKEGRRFRWLIENSPDDLTQQMHLLEIGELGEPA